MSRFEQRLAEFVQDHRLPDAYAEQARTFYLPLADWLLEKLDRSGGSPLVAGIYGAQGSGKSTLADLLCRTIESTGERSTLNLSIDDFYHTTRERARLAAEVSPLLATRGPPGTHDVDLALKTVRQAAALAPGESMTIPRFDKATDDRKPQADYDDAQGPIDLIVLEGWCLGSRSIDPERLLEPINDLERDEDKDGSWRRFVNASIESYQPLFDSIDVMIMLKTTNLESVLRWRSEQEEKLRTARHSQGSGIMSRTEIERFVQFFERVSKNTEQQVEQVADVVIVLGEDHQVRMVEYR